MNSLLFSLIQKLFPLYFFILLGFVAGRFLKLSRETIAILLIYVLVPGVVFGGVLTTDLTAARLSLPLLFWIICTLMGLIFFKGTKNILTHSRRGILSYAAGC